MKEATGRRNVRRRAATCCIGRGVKARVSVKETAFIEILDTQRYALVAE